MGSLITLNEVVLSFPVSMTFWYVVGHSALPCCAHCLNNNGKFVWGYKWCRHDDKTYCHEAWSSARERSSERKFYLPFLYFAVSVNDSVWGYACWFWVSMGDYHSSLVAEEFFSDGSRHWLEKERSSSSPWSVFWTKPAPRQLALVSVSPIADTTWAKNLRDVLNSLLFFIFTVWPGSLNLSSAAWTSIKLLFPAAGENNDAKQMPPSSSYRILSISFWIVAGVFFIQKA